MVRVISFKQSLSQEGKEFISLKVQGGIEAVQSAQTGKMYLTARTAYVSCTFDEQTAEALIGTEMPGKVERVSCEPYEYTVKDTGETMTLTHRFEYVMEDVPSVASKPIPQEQVHDFLEEVVA